MKIINFILAIGFFALVFQSCEKPAEATRMEDYLAAKEFTPTWTDQFTDFTSSWSQLENDGEVFFPYFYQVTDKANAMVYRNENGIRFDGYAGGWGQRFYREGFEVSGDFEIEFKVRIVQGTGDAAWQKGGIFVGDIGDAPTTLWLSLENPIEPNNGRVNRFIPGSAPEWLNIDEGNFSVFDWQIIRAVRVGNNFKIYRNGNEILDYTDNLVNNITGKVGISTEALSAEFEYLKVNGVTDDFTDLDNVDMGNWKNLTQSVNGTEPSTWTTDDEGLHITAQGGWNHRAVKESLPANFTVEFKIKLDNPTGMFPKAGLIVGELGDNPPSIIVGLDNNGGSSTVVHFIADRAKQWQNINVTDMDVNTWNTFRIEKSDNVMYIYLDNMRIYFEQGEHIKNIAGELGVFAESCDADFEFISFKEN